MRLAWKFLPAALVLLSLSSLAPAATASFVPGFERLRAAGGDWCAEAGEVLFSELSCAACHHDGPPRAPSLAWKSGPDLSAAGDRLRAAYVREFLADPATVKPGTTMPNLFAGVEAARKADLVEDLTHYLMSQHAKRSATELPPGVAKTGRELFYSVGCVACHLTPEMPRLGEKYAPGELARFLERPLSVRPAGRMPEQRISKKEASHLAAFLAPTSPAEAAAFAVDPDRVKRGREAFESLGCVACHGGGPEVKAVPVADVRRGCLAPEPLAGVPQYSLSEEQRESIRAALATRRASVSVDDPKLAIRRIMLQRNCFACHSRAGLGGPSPDVAAHFTSAKDDLGDLGRLPPRLDGVGRKFHRAALETVLRGKDRVRSYMHARMPDFGEELSRELSGLLAKADADPNEQRATAKADPKRAGRSEWGRELVGTGGYACIACHDLNGRKSLGIGAYDLAQMPKRLRPEWMRDFLLNPAAFPTGTRMPPFWPEGVASNPHIGGGKDALQQIDSIRVYLTEVDESLPPLGFSDAAAFEVKPTERPIIFRTFIAGAGSHAIAVGFPGGVNVAFDAYEVRWALAWRGRFLDADGTWNQRFIKFEKPLGENLVHLSEIGMPVLAGGEKTPPRFRGYRIGPDGVPVFSYELGALTVEDRIEPGTGHGLRRTIRVHGQTNETVQLAGQPPPGVSVKLTGGEPLPAKLEFRDGIAEIVEEIAW